MSTWNAALSNTDNLVVFEFVYTPYQIWLGCICGLAPLGLMGVQNSYFQQNTIVHNSCVAILSESASYFIVGFFFLD